MGTEEEEGYRGRGGVQRKRRGTEEEEGLCLTHTYP